MLPSDSATVLDEKSHSVTLIESISDHDTHTDSNTLVELRAEQDGQTDHERDKDDGPDDVPGPDTLSYSPQFKFKKLQEMATFLKSRYRLRRDVTVPKRDVIEVVNKEYDDKATGIMIGRAVTLAFGSKVNNRKKKQRDLYFGIEQYGCPFSVTVNPESKRERSPSPVPINADQAAAKADDQHHATKKLIVSAPRSSPPDSPVYKSLQRSTSLPTKLAAFVIGKKSSVPSRKTASPRLTAVKRRTQSTQTLLPPGVRMEIRTEEKKDISSHPLEISPSDSTHNIPVKLSLDELMAITMLRKKDPGLLKHMADKISSHVNELAVEHTNRLVKKEIMAYAANENCLMKKSSAEDLHNFNLLKFWDEFKDQIPTLTNVVTSACTRKDQDNLKKKTMNSITPAITVVIGKCLGIYSRRMSAIRSLYSLLLSDGGVTDSCMNRLAKLYDCVTHQSIIGRLNDIAKRYNVELRTWLDFCVVFDNVDAMIKPRRQTAEKQNVMTHMVQAIAVKDRVLPPHLSDPSSSKPKIAIEDVKPADLYPTPQDDQALSKLMVQMVLEVWSEMPALVSHNLVENRPHRYTEYTSKKSKQANIGVLKRNENVKEDLFVCLQEYHKLTETEDGSLSHKFCIGDYLSFERGKEVLHTQSDAKTPTDRLEGILMGMADFHVQMNFLKMIYKMLFKGDSQPSSGTLSHAKDLLNARNVTADPTSRYYDCGALFDKVFHAYLFTAALQELGLQSVDDSNGESLDKTAIVKAAEKVVDEYVKLSLPDLEDTAKIRCRHCQKKYANEKTLRKHQQQFHGGEALPADPQLDAKYGYTCCVITLGLFRQIHNSSIRVANGEHIMLLYKYMYVMFKTNGCFKYGCGLLETILQTQVLPQDLSFKLVWNRSCNSYNLPDTNIPLDLQLEHENRMFKERLKSYRGEYSDPHLQRISKGRAIVKEVITRLDGSLQYHAPSSRAKRDVCVTDVVLLIDKMKDEQLLSAHGSRTHSPSLLTTAANPVAGTSGKKVKEWMLERIDMCQVRRYYKQFSG